MLGRRKEQSERPNRELRDKERFRSRDGPAEDYRLEERNLDRPVDLEMHQNPDLPDIEGSRSRYRSYEGNADYMEEGRPNRELRDEGRFRSRDGPPEDFRLEERNLERPVDLEMHQNPEFRNIEDSWSRYRSYEGNPDYMEEGRADFGGEEHHPRSDRYPNRIDGKDDLSSSDLESGPKKQNTGGLDIPFKFHPAKPGTFRYFIGHIITFTIILTILLLSGLGANAYSISLKASTDRSEIPLTDSDFWATVAQLSSGTMAGLYLICVPWAQSGSVNVRGRLLGSVSFVVFLVSSLMLGLASTFLCPFSARSSMAVAHLSGLAQIVATFQLIYATSREIQEQAVKIEQQKVDALVQAEELRRKEEEAREKEMEAVEREKELARIKKELEDAQAAAAAAGASKEGGAESNEIDEDLYDAAMNLILKVKAKGKELPYTLGIMERLWKEDEEGGA